MFTRQEGSDDTRDVVAQRSVNLPYMTQSRDVTGGVLTTDKVANGVGGSWTSVKLAPVDEPDLPETRYIYSTVISENNINDASRLQWLADRLDFDIGGLTNRRMEVVRLLPFGSIKRPKQRTLAFSEVGDGASGNHFFLWFGVTSSVKAALGDVTYERVILGVPTPFLTQYITIAPRGEALAQYTLSIVFQPATTGVRESYTIDGSAESVVLGYEKGGRSHFGIPYLHYEVEPSDMVIHPGLQQIRYIRASVHSDASDQVTTHANTLIYEAPRGIYYGDPIVVRISNTKLLALVFNVATNTIENVLGEDVVTAIVVGAPLAFVSTDNGTSWQSATPPSFDMVNYTPNPTFVDYKYSVYNRANNPFQIQFRTKMVPWSKTHAFGASLFYKNANSSSGGEYKAFLWDGATPEYISIPIDAYKYVLIHACRPMGAVVLTFRARAAATYASYEDGIYPSVSDAYFNALSVSGYATNAVIAVYDGDTLEIRELPWSRLYAHGPVFSMGGKEIGTVVYNTSPSVGSNAYWVFSSKDYGVTWKEKFLVDGLSDPPSYSTDGPAQKEVVYTDGSVYSLPPQIIFPELVEGEKIPPCPGALWLT